MHYLDWRFFPTDDAVDPASAYHGLYEPGLVAVSLAIAILAAFVALSISGRIVAARTARARLAWATAGAISMGGGIWAMHFIGMLAFSLPCGVFYDPIGTILSMVPGALASGIALAVISRRASPGLTHLLLGAVLMGAGIGTMHYSGMAAMRPEALLLYDPGLVALSVVVAVALAFISLSIRFHLARGVWPTLAAASVMGCAVAGMHYTAMQAAIFFPLNDASIWSMALPKAMLAIGIVTVTVLIAISTLLATFAGRQTELAQVLRAEVAERKRTEAELIQARQQAEAANLFKSQFLARMSHELRTPLNAVIGYSELLLEDAGGEDRPEQTVDLRRINSAGRHLLSLVNDVLDLSKIEAGKMELEAAPLDLDGLVDDVVATCEPLVLANGNEFAIERGAGLGTVIGDATKLRQIMLNLLSNAAKFTENGRITLTVTRDTRPAGDWITIAVRDTGIGISVDDLSKLFGNFSQVNPAITNKYGGTGLGLALSQKLCRAMGGEITVTSEPGRGSCFSILLPAVMTEAEHAAAA